MVLASAISKALASKTLAHHNVNAHGASPVPCYGHSWMKIPILNQVLMNREGMDWFKFQGQWKEPGAQVTCFHATQLQFLHCAAPYAPNSGGILAQGCLLSGMNGHGGDHGVFVHGSPEGAAFYAISSRAQWPNQPMCFLEVAATNLKVVKGGMADRYCACALPGTTNTKVELRYV